jgi:hypothetical protein
MMEPNEVKEQSANEADVRQNREDLVMEKDNEYQQNSPRSHAGLTISPSHPATTQLSGSLPTAIMLKRRDDDDDLPVPNEPPPPPPPTSVPDFAMEFEPCLDEFKDIFDDVPDNLEEIVLRGLRALFGGDVRSLCSISQDTGRRTQKFGIWLTLATSESVSNARDRGVQAIDFSIPSRSFTFFISSSFLRRIASDAWDNQPKILNGDFIPDPNGPIHLTSFSVSFDFPDKVVTKVGGFDERPWPDLPFEYVVTDTMTVNGFKVKADSVTKLIADDTLQKILAAISLPVGGILLSSLFLAQVIFISLIDDPDPQSGVGGVAAELFPTELMIRGGKKIVLIYGTPPRVTGGGIWAEGGFLSVNREPSVSILGKSEIAVKPGSSFVTGVYEVTTEDLLSPLSISWKADNPVLGSPKRTSLAFRYPEASPGEIIERQISVSVTDVDNLVATAEKTVRIFVTAEEDDPIDPECQAKPWSPHCREAFARLAANKRVNN